MRTIAAIVKWSTYVGALAAMLGGENAAGTATTLAVFCLFWQREEAKDGQDQNGHKPADPPS